MTRTELRWARAAFGAIFPAGAHERLSVGIADMDVEGFVLDVQRRSPFKAALALRAAVWIVAVAPLFVLRRFATIASASLDATAREAVVQRLLASGSYPVRQLVILLKTIGALLWASAPAVRKAMIVPHDVEVPVPARSGPRLIELRVPRRPGAEAEAERKDEAAGAGDEGDSAGGRRHGNVA